MGKLLNLVTPLHKATQRDYIGRMLDEKVHCMLIAKKYGEDYWDGDRRYGYGGYRFIPGRWKPVAEGLIKEYNLSEESRVLDIGCGKAFLLHELKLLLPGIEVCVIDISGHGLKNSTEEIRPYLFRQRAQDPLPFGDNAFDLVISLGAFHNFRLFELQTSLQEMQRVGQHGFLMLESYRNEQELFNLQCWALTAESFFEMSEWIWLYNHFGYKGDYEFIYFE